MHLMLPSAKEIPRLPRWECIALAARCARMMLDHTGGALRLAGAESGVRKAVEFAEDVASKPADATDRTVAMRLIDGTMELRDAIVDSEKIRDRGMKTAAAYTADAACFALMATEGDQQSAAKYAEKALEGYHSFLKLLML